MKRARVLSAVLCFCLMATTFSGCGGNAGTSPSTAASTDTTESAATATEDKSDILIGVSTGITGSSPSDGDRTTKGTQLAVEEINANGGVLGGRKLKLDIEDDQNLANVAVNIANKLMSQKIVAMLGPQKSSNALAVQPVALQYKIPFLSGGTSPSLLTAKNPEFFRLRASDSLCAKIAAKYCVETLGAKNIGILYNNDDYGTGGKKVAEEYLKSINIPCVSAGHNTGDKDSTGQILQLKDKKVDAIIVWTHAPECAVIAKQLNDLQIKVPVVGCATTSAADFLNLCDGSVVNGIYSIADFSVEDPDAKVQAFVKAVNEKYKMVPDVFMTTYYDGVYVVADAINRAGSTDPEAIRKALSETKDVKGVLGTYTANESGELLHEAVIVQMKADKTQKMIKKVTE